MENDKSLGFDAQQIAFLRTMSHELRSPLNSVMATCEMLLDAVYGDLQPKQFIATERVLRNSQRLLDLIAAISLYARVSAENIEPVIVSFSVKGLLDQEIERHRKTLDEKSLTVELMIDPDVPRTMDGNLDHLTPLMRACISNAVQFTVTGTINIQVSMEGAQWVVCINDTGVGISAEDLPHVVEPFWRGKYAKQNHRDGNGLGLSIAYEIAQRLGGSFAIQSQVGVGTSVRVALPQTKISEA